MRKGILLSLILMFLFNIIGYNVLHFVLEGYYKNQMHAEIKKALTLDKLQIHKSELKNLIFKDEGKEVMFHGEMYDIHQRMDSADYVIFYCIHDKKETNLLVAFAEHINQNTNSQQSSSEKQNHFDKDLSKYLSDAKGIFFYNLYSTITFRKVTATLQQIYLDPTPLPPPEVIVA